MRRVKRILLIAERRVGGRADTGVLGSDGKPPTIILGPGKMTMAHQTDEYCRGSRIEEAAGVYETLARRWCGL